MWRPGESKSQANFDTTDIRIIHNKPITGILDDLAKGYNVTLIYTNGYPIDERKLCMGYSIKQPLQELLDDIASPFWGFNLKFKIRGKTVFVYTCQKQLKVCYKR